MEPRMGQEETIRQNEAYEYAAQVPFFIAVFARHSAKS
jgi:hypothetical protein